MLITGTHTGLVGVKIVIDEIGRTSDDPSWIEYALVDIELSTIEMEAIPLGGLGGCIAFTLPRAGRYTVRVQGRNRPGHNEPEWDEVDPDLQERYILTLTSVE
ncbi:hypothetical protein ACFQRL_00070 [Microbacterium fluvii]|uniref:Uncharacterized protein n=1 Tax=Microbacterium fluvii TaxID=415215 RepID=A0ABW2H7J4_9MICO|nr:hypothetical protein [Microbacterium fluvii]MCU4670980.1 hypothetical protein [Microbacterium fluvii]